METHHVMPFKTQKTSSDLTAVVTHSRGSFTPSHALALTLPQLLLLYPYSFLTTGNYLHGWQKYAKNSNSKFETLEHDISAGSSVGDDSKTPVNPACL
jgi:hypothetical protein